MYWYKRFYYIITVLWLNKTNHPSAVLVHYSNTMIITITMCIFEHFQKRLRKYFLSQQTVSSNWTRSNPCSTAQSSHKCRPVSGPTLAALKKGKTLSEFRLEKCIQLFPTLGELVHVLTALLLLSSLRSHKFDRFSETAETDLLPPPLFGGGDGWTF